MKTFKTIIKAIMTEKSSRAQEKGKYTFMIKRDASKTDVKNAVKEIYGAEVATVRTALVPKKVRLVGRGKSLTKRSYHKKAIVTLKGGKTIDINKFKATK
ncbi:50S ribosomal protein L23 [Patescibacteria group bacterium]|nr:50S ribosomal protein L23 [Patescibacteria group bacterium]